MYTYARVKIDSDSGRRQILTENQEDKRSLYERRLKIVGSDKEEDYTELSVLDHLILPGRNCNACHQVQIAFYLVADVKLT